MKKIYLFLISASTSFYGIHAQISLTAAVHNYAAGSNFNFYLADTTGIVPGLTGANQTWNFSNLTIGTSLNTQSYVSSASTPYGSGIPSANVAIGVSGEYAYYKTSPSDMRAEGIADASLTLAYSDDQLVFTYPFTYNTMVTDSFKGNCTTSGGDDLFRTGKSITTGVGYGTLILPGGTHNNVLKVKLVQNIRDSIDGVYTQMNTLTSYYWYDAATMFPLLMIHYIQSYYTFNPGNINKTKYIYVNSVAAGVNEINLDNYFSVYPNPSGGKINITSSMSNVQYKSTEVYTIEGEKIYQSTTNTDKSEINLSSQPNGVYFLQLKTEQGTATKKIIINK